MWLPDGHFPTESFQKPRGGSAGLRVTWTSTGPLIVAVAASSGAPSFQGRLSGFGARDTTALKAAGECAETAAFGRGGLMVAYVGCYASILKLLAQATGI